MTDFRVVLLGAGAVGILPAVKLLEHPEISLLAAADKERVDRCRRNGIFFNDRLLPLEFACPGEMTGLLPADLIIVATKTTGLPAALDNIIPVTGKNTIFLPLLNGISAADEIAARFPENITLKGFFLGHASVRENNRIYHDGVGKFYIGGEKTAVNTVENLFNSCGIEVEIPQDIDHAIWKKFILNVGINQTQALFKADYGMVQKSPELLDFCRNLMREAVFVAEAENISGTSGMIDEAIKVITSMPPDVKTSMLQDVLAGRATEVMAFAGVICEKAAKYGISTPFNQQVLSGLV